MAVQRRPAKAGMVKKSATIKKKAQRRAAPVEDDDEDVAVLEKPRSKRRSPEEHAKHAQIKKQVDKEFEEEVEESNDDSLESIPEDIDSVGDESSDLIETAFIRMLNNRGHVTAVHARHIVNRIVDGYSFIVGEPSIPILKSDTPDVCFNAKKKGWQPYARKHPVCDKHADAYKVWVAFMRKDRVAYKDRDDLWYEAIDAAVQSYRQFENPGGFGTSHNARV